MDKEKKGNIGSVWNLKVLRKKQRENKEKKLKERKFGEKKCLNLIN